MEHVRQVFTLKMIKNYHNSIAGVNIMITNMSEDCICIESRYLCLKQLKQGDRVIWNGTCLSLK